MKIAVVGSGISGLSAAYYLSKKHTVDLFEKENHFGGHSYTIDIEYEEKKNIAVDIGFIVFNKNTYPNLINFFDENKILYEKSNMSFSVNVDNGSIEYSGKGLKGFLSNKSNIFNLKFLKMFFEIIKFYRKCSNLSISSSNNETLEEFLNREKLSKYFVNFHIIPMVSAIWSMPSDKAKKMPLKFFINFFNNHGLFKIKDRPQWYTVSGRSKTYVKNILGKISGEYYKNYKINKITKSNNNVQIFYGKENEYFIYDKVVIAAHADEALKLIEKPSKLETEVLKNFQYKNNTAVIHCDDSYMPKNNFNWCSWNSSMSSEKTNNPSITYWLNLLQNLNIKKNIFLTLNPYKKIPQDKIFNTVNFTHPFFDNNSIKYQKELYKIQNKENLLFCGSYFGNGFHEDGIKSSIEMIKHLND